MHMVNTNAGRAQHAAPLLEHASLTKTNACGVMDGQGSMFQDTEDPAAEPLEAFPHLLNLPRCIEDPQIGYLCLLFDDAAKLGYRLPFLFSSGYQRVSEFYRSFMVITSAPLA